MLEGARREEPDERELAGWIGSALPVGTPVEARVCGPAHRPTAQVGPGTPAESDGPRMFGSRFVNDGTGMIKLDSACIVERDVHLAVSVEVNWPMVLAKAVARLYLVADANCEPVLARVLLIPDIVPPHVAVNVRLEDSGYLRAIVECGDGSLLQVKRWVWVVPSER